MSTQQLCCAPHTTTPPCRLGVKEAENDDSSVVCLHEDTLEELELFRYVRITLVNLHTIHHNTEATQ